MYYFGDDESNLSDYAWFYYNAYGATHEVGQKKPNPWDLYDIHGNVRELVLDKWHDNYIGAPTDGSAWERGNSSSHVHRGGGMRNPADNCRSADRSFFRIDDREDYVGFRLVRDV
ncbi:MAG: formylglycine-generating enzyme family protein, partial [Methanobacteriota archaeon]